MRYELGWPDLRNWNGGENWSEIKLRIDKMNGNGRAN